MKLIILESPNKVKTVNQFLSKDYVCAASVGHIRKIADSGVHRMGIDPKTFDADFIVDPGKKDVIKHLKELVAKADEVILMTDPDTEGEAISWHLKEVLKIPPKKLKRCTTTEITKKGVTEALANPRKIDEDLVDAANARAKLDKIIGYRLSPISRRKVSARSVGRCQSVALKIVVEREEEILNFVPKTYYEIWLPFVKDNIEYKAQYKGHLDVKKVTTTIDDKKKAESIIKDCKGNDYIVHSIESKDRTVAPKPPFTTITFQQEASSRLGYSVKKAQQIAQMLFEGIDIAGKHVPLITYIRTDSTVLSDEFIESAKSFIDKKDYEGVRDKKKMKKEKNVQGAHEAIRPVDLSMTPEKLTSYIADQQMIKIYTLIYNRALASLMKDAVILDTTFTIVNNKHKFCYTEHAYKYKGWKALYDYDDEDINKGIDLFTNEKVNAKELELVEKTTQPKSRFSEATLIKQLNEYGIGRPSTMSNIISIILDPGRGYCELQGKLIAPTQKGITLSHFLDEAFPDIINYDYSSHLEEQLDEIAKGKVSEIDFLTKFYKDLETMIKNTKTITVEKPEKEFVEGKVCPKCGNKLVIRQSRYGKFAGCLDFPRCKHTEKLNG